MDGVLIEARDWHYEALNKALRLFGYEISRFDHLTTYDGLPTKRKLEMLTVERGLPTGLHPFINEMKQVYTMELVHTQCKPRFLHEFALSRLKAMGYMLGVASNSIRSTVDVMMRLAHLDQYLDLTLSNEDVSKSKPDPEIYLTAMNRFQVGPTECLVVEDNENGIKSAKSAGAHILAVRGVEDVTFEALERAIRRAEGRPS